MRIAAISLIGNYSSTNSSTMTGIDSTTQKAVGFTLPPGTSYQLDNIVLRLSFYITPTDTALLQIYADAAKNSTSPSGATLQPVVFNNPTSNSDTASSFIFAPTSNFTFAADTRYWLLVDATAGFYNWTIDSSNIAPTGISGIIFNGYQFSFENGASYFGDADSTLSRSMLRLSLSLLSLRRQAV